LLADAFTEAGQDSFRVFRPGEEHGIYTYNGQHNLDIMPGFNDLSVADMEEQANVWWPRILAATVAEEQRLGVRIDAIQPRNESDSADIEVMQKLVAYESALIDLADADGRTLVIGSYSTNSPDWGSGVWQDICAPFIQEAWAKGHIYGRHSYFDVPPTDDNINRPFMEIDYLRNLGPTGPVIISEAGFVTFPSVDVFMEAIRDYDIMLSNYDEIGYAALFTYGDWWNANIQSASNAMSEYLQANQPTEWIPGYSQPEPPPPSGACDPRVPYNRTYNVIPQDAAESRAVEIFLEGWRRSKETSGGSYDDAGFGPNLTSVTVNLYDIPEEQRQEYADWYDEHYPSADYGFVGDGSLPPPPQLTLPVNYCQRDTRWASVEMGDGKRIGNFGCLLVCYSEAAIYYGLFADTPDAFLTRAQDAGAMSGPYTNAGALQTIFPDNIIYHGNLGRGEELNNLTRSYIDLGKPVLARVDFIPETGQLDQHWVLVIGYTEEDDFIIADPWHGDEVLLSTRYNISGRDLLEGLFYSMDDSTSPPPSNEYTGPDVTFESGVDQPASDWRWPEAKAVFDVTGLGCKFHTTGNSYQWYDAYKKPFTLVRIALDPTFAGDIFQETVNNVAQFYDQGARDFEVLNEPNIEGMGVRWNNGTEFGIVFNDLCRQYKERFPEIRLWYPGLSPSFAQFAFTDAAISAGAFDLIWGVCCHAYSGDITNATTAASEILSEALLFRERYAMTRPLCVSEFSVNRPQDGTYKAQVYHVVYDDLATIPGVQAAISFTADWYPDPDLNEEGWLLAGVHNAW
jgi:hypothetical protein